MTLLATVAWRTQKLGGNLEARRPIADLNWIKECTWARWQQDAELLFSRFQDAVHNGNSTPTSRRNRARVIEITGGATDVLSMGRTADTAVTTTVTC
ncbi:hypothetical protein PRZ48_003960 [Zasmidium cellare]|uniref:Transposase n=1 Tax=Zasmidium cellare TaxID=395010 RepID=A0ABR0EY48_ZASCE|nr:hypothetical protein PRZ48_003960 [Zasmidium cellare]